MERRLRITGLVRVADGVRRELGQPLSSERRDQLRRRVQATLDQVSRILRNASMNRSALPAPSRRAIEFLESVNWNEVPTSESAPHAPQISRVKWTGLARFVERAMDELDQAREPSGQESVRESIARMSRQIELTIERQKLSPQQITETRRELRAWLALMTRLEMFTTYLTARAAAADAVAPAVARQRRFPPPLRIHFRPMQGLYRIRAARHGSLLSLPTPMIAFDAAGFRDVSELVFGPGGDARRRVLERMMGPDSQAIAAELEALGGIVEETRGAFHDLSDSFDRVNTRYFAGSMPRPRLTWSRSFTGRKFGHYEWIGDAVMLSRTLDSASVPAFVVDFVMYHELLHKQHGLRWSNGRRYAHTPEFYADERKFEKHAEAEAELDKLARRT